jgi:uncharacterized protein (DUF433 family)
MEYPASPYIYWTGYGLRIMGSRVSLDSILIGHLRGGETAEQLAEGYPTVPLSHIQGAIAYYHEHQELIDEYLAEGDRKVAAVPPLSQRDPELFARLEAARKRLHSKSA